MPYDVYIDSGLPNPKDIKVYASTILDVAPIGWTWGSPLPPRTDHGRTVFTWRLAIAATGTVEHHQPEPVMVRTTLTSLGKTQARTTTTLHCATVSGGEAAGSSTVAHRIEALVTATIVDPDEWLIFDDPALS